MYSVHQHWDPLQVCAVGKSYPPEFYSWIKTANTRHLFEKIATETEEDLQNLVSVLEKFNVTVVRPDIPESIPRYKTGFPTPPLSPRDCMLMIGDKFNFTLKPWEAFYEEVKDSSWPEHTSNIDELSIEQQHECRTVHNWDLLESNNAPWQRIINLVKQQGNHVTHRHALPFINGSQVGRIGRDLYFGTDHDNTDIAERKRIVDREFPGYRNHIVASSGHVDGIYCMACPGLIISRQDVPDDYFKKWDNWEVVSIPPTNWEHEFSFTQLKQYNQGRWWIPGYENNQSVIDTVENYLSNWVGYVEETVFDINMLFIDPKNVIVVQYNETMFKALERYGITPHIVNFRHRYFWDAGIHCLTADLSRSGKLQDFFPDTQLT